MSRFNLKSALAAMVFVAAAGCGGGDEYSFRSAAVHFSPAQAGEFCVMNDDRTNVRNIGIVLTDGRCSVDYPSAYGDPTTEACLVCPDGRKVCNHGVPKAPPEMICRWSDIFGR